MTLFQIDLENFHAIAAHECVIIKITHTMTLVVRIFVNKFLMCSFITWVTANRVEFLFLAALPKNVIPTEFLDTVIINFCKWFWMISSNAKNLVQFRNMSLIVHTLILSKGCWSFIDPIIDGTIFSIAPVCTEWACAEVSIFWNQTISYAWIFIGFSWCVQFS